LKLWLMTWFYMFVPKNKQVIALVFFGVIISLFLFLTIYKSADSSNRSVNFILPDLHSSEMTSLDDGSGQLIYLDVWAIWCKPCLEILPKIQKLSVEYVDKPIQFIGINQDLNPEAAIEFLSANNIRFRQLHDPLGEVLVLLKLKGMPASILLDQSGHIVYLKEGTSPDAMTELQGKIDQVLLQGH